MQESAPGRDYTFQTGLSWVHGHLLSHDLDLLLYRPYRKVYIGSGDAPPHFNHKSDRNSIMLTCYRQSSRNGSGIR